MLSRSHRLNKKRDIETVFKRGKSVYAGALGLRAAANRLPVSRFTIVVSLKVSKKAVERNRLKRRLREIMRQEIVPRAKNGFDGIILTQKPLLDLSFPELRELALALFKKAGLLS